MASEPLKLTRAQRKLMEQLDRACAVPYEERNAGTFRFHGRGMARTLEALKRMGLLDYEEINGLTGTYFYVTRNKPCAV